MHKPLRVPDHLKLNVLFKNMLIKHGNEARALKFLLELYSLSVLHLNGVNYD